MDDFRRLDVEIQLEQIRCRREGFLAANAERFRRDEAQAYGEEDFEELDRFLERLRAIIRDA
jgi:hypothetical protein